MVEPAELLKHLGVIRIVFENVFVGILRRVVLEKDESSKSTSVNRAEIHGMTRTESGRSKAKPIKPGPEKIETYVFHLLVHMTNLKPDINARKWVRWASQYTLETL